jgi:hypothetical protein
MSDTLRIRGAKKVQAWRARVGVPVKDLMEAARIWDNLSKGQKADLLRNTPEAGDFSVKTNTLTYNAREVLKLNGGKPK